MGKRGQKSCSLRPTATAKRVWNRLTAGDAIGGELVRDLAARDVERREAAGVFVSVGGPPDLRRAEDILYRAAGTEADSPIDRLVHRRCSRWITRALIPTGATPNQVSVLSLAIGIASVSCLWHATPLRSVWAIALYALASIVDHSDGELARLTFRESATGAQLDWAIDTAIHAGLVLAMAVTVGGPIFAAVGAVGSAGVVLSAWCARRLPRARGGASAARTALRRMGTRDLFYAVLAVFALALSVEPRLLGAVSLLTAAGTQAYWITCATLMREQRAPRRAA